MNQSYLCFPIILSMSPQKIFIFFCLISFISLDLYSQVGIGTTSPHASSVLDIKSSDSGVLIPRIALDSTLDTSSISSPEISLLVYNTSSFNDLSPGFYFWNGNKWNRIVDSELVYGEIYKTFPSNSQTINLSVPVKFGAIGEYQGVNPSSNYIEVTKSGIYRVTYSVSVLKSGGGTVTLGFYLAIGDTPSNSVAIPGSSSHTEVSNLGNGACSMNKIVHIDANKKIYLFPDISYTTVYIKAGAAAMNVELIKAD